MVGISYGQGPVEESYDKGMGYAVQGRFKEAREWFEEALKIDPFHTPAKRGIKVIEDVMEQRIKGEVAIHLFLGTAYSNRGMLDEALAEFDRAIAISPDYDLAYSNRGLAHMDKGHYNLAILDYNRSIEINPKYAEAYNNRGFAYIFLEGYNRAIADFNKALEINPNLAEAYNNRGFVYMAILGDKKQACSDWKRACELGLCGNYGLARKEGDCDN